MNFRTTYDVMTDPAGMRLGPDMSVIVHVTSSLCSLLFLAVLVALALIYFTGLTDWRPSWEFSWWHILFVLVWKITTMLKWMEGYGIWKDRAREWVAKGIYATIEGKVESRSITCRDGKSLLPDTASIKMANQEFREQNWQDALRTGFGVGDYVRITHHEGAVLKVEVAEQSPRSVRES